MPEVNSDGTMKVPAPETSAPITAAPEPITVTPTVDETKIEDEAELDQEVDEDADDEDQSEEEEKSDEEVE